MIFLREYVLEAALRECVATQLELALHRIPTDSEIDAIFGKRLVDTEARLREAHQQ